MKYLLKLCFYLWYVCLHELICTTRVQMPVEPRALARLQLGLEVVYGT